MSGRLVLLGTGTCELTEDRAASSVLVELPEVRFVFDFGRGVASRLARLGLRQDDVRHIVLSHFHPDHVSDLIPFLHAALYSPRDPRTADLRIYGPDGLKDVMARIVALVGMDDLEASARFELVLRPLADRVRIGSLEASTRHLPPVNNRGLRLEHDGTSLAMTGDSDFHEEEVSFLRDVDLAIIDAGHLSDEQIVELAVRGRPRRMICSHLYRELDAAVLQGQAARLGFQGRLEVGHDLLEIAL